jgi:hypothetical protein
MYLWSVVLGQIKIQEASSGASRHHSSSGFMSQHDGQQP